MSMKNFRMNVFKSEIKRSYKIYGDVIGLEFNASLIGIWKQSRFINEKEYHELRSYNRKCCDEYPDNELSKLWGAVVKDASNSESKTRR